MLGTFYVGGKKFLNYPIEENSTLFQTHWTENENSKNKKGRLWHGRPPVKIVERYT
jgi:hypothetical protein